MKPWVRNSLNVGALTAGALLASGAAAQASPTMTSTDNVGALNGTQAVLPIQVPINICGNAAAVGGTSSAACRGGATALNPEWSYDYYAQDTPASGPTLLSTGGTGVGNGTQLYAPIQVPVNVCGNAVAALGTASARCAGGASTDPGTDPGDGYEKPGDGYEKPGHRHRDGSGSGHDGDRHDRHGDRHDRYGHDGDGYDRYGYEGHGAGGPAERLSHAPAELVAPSGAGPELVSSGNVGLLSGTQVLLPVQIPINICGNAIGVLGSAEAGCQGGASATDAG